MTLLPAVDSSFTPLSSLLCSPASPSDVSVLPLPSCYAVKDDEESYGEGPAVELILSQPVPQVHKFGRSSLDCVMHHGLLSVPAGDEPLLRRRSDPGVRQYSLASAICALNASLANIINATSYSTVTNNSSSISRFIEEAAFQALRSSSSSGASHLEGGDVSAEALDSPPEEEDSISAPLGESSDSSASAEATTRSLDSLSAECGDSDSQSVSEAPPPSAGHALLVNGDVLQMLRMRNSQLSVKPIGDTGGCLTACCCLRGLLSGRNGVVDAMEACFIAARSVARRLPYSGASDKSEPKEDEKRPVYSIHSVNNIQK